MGRKSTGTVRILQGEHGPQWHAKWTLADGTRTDWEPLDPKIALDDVDGAKAEAVRQAPKYKQKTSPGGGGTIETVEAYSKRWLAARTARTARDNGSHLEHHVLPVLRRVAMTEVAAAHGDAIVAALDAKIAAGTLSDKSARNIWGTARRLMKDAAHAKRSTGLRCLETNPFRDVMPPERTRGTRSKQFLYPSELLTLVHCPDVPANWKRNAAIATYLGLRDGEQRALRWAHVDLDHATVTVCETYDRESKQAR